MPDRLTAAQLDEFERLEKAATKGLWERVGSDDYSCTSVFFVAGPDGTMIVSEEGIEVDADVLSEPCAVALWQTGKL